MPPAQKHPLSTDSGQVLRSVSECLRSLIRNNVPELHPESAVVFDSPADIDSQGENKLSLFLYHMAVDPFLRNLPPTLTRQQGVGPMSLMTAPPPLVVNLTYVLVPYAKSAELELVLADKLSRLFHTVRALTGPLLDPMLREAGNSSIAIVPDPASIDSLRNLWAGFPGKSYKLTQLYQLSPVRIPGGPGRPTDMTTDASLGAASRGGEVDH